ncbi:MAG: hypothetical protein PVI93_23550, partial [Desulfobacterales bacterium]
SGPCKDIKISDNFEAAPREPANFFLSCHLALVNSEKEKSSLFIKESKSTKFGLSVGSPPVRFR